ISGSRIGGVRPVSVQLEPPIRSPSVVDLSSRTAPPPPPPPQAAARAAAEHTLSSQRWRRASSSLLLLLNERHGPYFALQAVCPPARPAVPNRCSERHVPPTFGGTSLETAGPVVEAMARGLRLIDSAEGRSAYSSALIGVRLGKGVAVASMSGYHL
ncbi:unnamed protein product, partial [Lampetra planeri]